MRCDPVVVFGFSGDNNVLLVEIRICRSTARHPQKSVDELAHEVIAGKWGNGQDRRNRLTAEGYDYDAVQACVNALKR